MKYFVKHGTEFKEVTEDEFNRIQKLNLELGKAATSPFAKGLLARKQASRGVPRRDLSYGRSRGDAPQSDSQHLRRWK